ncbi:protein STRICTOSIDINE SYNTHASE-LIKE 6-like [Gastrolobium bilobum]|uniref:protein STRICTOSIDINE SYNTHASE-LIKE 6-like n=1 Tax=Gastrolobium bilobum TaxID=150636 RepID=UPI002AAF7C63|nr:protein STRICTOSIDINE SYNTHASE-LIKE 6-like [Gastrolobium bilobum]
MSESSRVGSASSSFPDHSDFQSPTKRRTRKRSCLLTVSFVITFPVVVAAVLYRLDRFEPAQFPVDELSRRTVTVPARNSRMRKGSEVVAMGEVSGPEDLAYDKESGVIYTGCDDGWIKRVTVKDSASDSVVENWVNTGGRPLGLAFGKNGDIIVADANKGLVRVTREKKVEVLADEVEGLKFKLTDGVDVADDGNIYFTDASYKYNVKDYVFDILEGKPHGRFMNYNPATKNVTLLARNLYFANGVAVSPDQNFVVFCETVLRRCRKFYIQGPKKGLISEFCRDLPGMPDNIHYVGGGKYYIGMATSLTSELDLALRYPFIRKVAAMVAKYIGRVQVEKSGGVLVVDLEGKPKAHYYDLELSLIASGIPIGNHIYCGSITYPFIIRLDVDKYPALPSK